MDQEALYQRQAGSLKNTAEHSHPALVARDQFVISHIAEQFSERRMRIAELSVGEGRMSLEVLRQLPWAELTCGDISAKRIDFVRKAIAVDRALQDREPAFYILNFDNEFDRLPDAGFDAVIALDIMEHVFDVFGFMSHCHRILRDGGLLYLRVPNIAYIRHRIGLLVGRIPVTSSWFETPGELTSWRDMHSWDGGHLHNFTIPVLRQLLAEYAFDVIDCRDPGARFGWIRDHLPHLLYANPCFVARKVGKSSDVGHR